MFSYKKQTLLLGNPLSDYTGLLLNIMDSIFSTTISSIISSVPLISLSSTEMKNTNKATQTKQSCFKCNIFLNILLVPDLDLEVLFHSFSHQIFIEH